MLSSRREARDVTTKLGESFVRLRTDECFLFQDGRVAPLIEQRARLLRQDRIRRNLSRKLEARPGPLELVTRKILQADADLEQAIEVKTLRNPQTCKFPGFRGVHDIFPSPCILQQLEI
ncbi:RPEL repeat protein [Ancylostoma ceylanicum]|uniref:RPEL repeat protein n=1 Tax=Ancylostoma ceylanicum TaxID=53326 RepID=A0A0D6M9M3_9BILA|nr:RPEL repeat protein [Ancylostoma ceylanicum]